MTYMLYKKNIYTRTYMCATHNMLFKIELENVGYSYIVRLLQKKMLM